ncbi:hypothetical protein TAMA11512_00190 [Selenomonas sp. TAMA-11512]|uniref:hypothetical protein n=1 Tax=Selenomonas sp. TAMA-11512 TaxID=3095337 RepID=UPI003091BC42|nr:hypothetical protein TAMA11512_00190 [Selenomonas sp. TAMA-11512]
MNVSQIASQAASLYQSSSKTNGAQKSGAVETAAKPDAAYNVEISANAKSAASAKDAGKAAEAAGAAKAKGLTNDQVSALQSDLDRSYSLMIQTMSELNAKLQGYQDQGIGWLVGENGRKVSTAMFALPAVATTPEEAAKAIAPGGDWSVEAVSDRIMNLAVAIAGSDPAMLEKMRGAVEKGFEQAGVAFKSAFGTDKMPAITDETHTHIMKRFDDLLQKKPDTASAGQA